MKSVYDMSKLSFILWIFLTSNSNWFAFFGFFIHISST